MKLIDYILSDPMHFSDCVRIDVNSTFECLQKASTRATGITAGQLLAGAPLIAPFPSMLLEWTSPSGKTPCGAYLVDNPEQGRFYGLDFQYQYKQDTFKPTPFCIRYDTARRWVSVSRLQIPGLPDIGEYEKRDMLSASICSYFLHQAQWRTLTTFRRVGHLLKFNTNPLERVQAAGMLTRAHFMEFRTKEHGGGGAAFGCSKCNSGEGHPHSTAFAGLSHLGLFECPASGVQLDVVLGSALRMKLQNSEPTREDVQKCQIRELQRLQKLTEQHSQTLYSQMQLMSKGLC